MVIGMATRKITITLPEEQLEEVRALVSRNRVSSVSGFLQHAVKIALSDVADFDRDIQQSLERTGGPLTAEEAAWADAVLAGEAPESKPKRGHSRKPNKAA
jgi:Arc/MetJ-type ribon-helix-helix transcriptional regulator